VRDSRVELTQGDQTMKDWRDVLLDCIKELEAMKDRKLWCQALKYTMMDGELYRMTIDGLLMKCLSEEQAKVAMGEVHEGMCGTHQLAHKMK
jgi:hypothetical protein